jgi:hypothetical protein
MRSAVEYVCFSTSCKSVVFFLQGHSGSTVTPNMVLFATSSGYWSTNGVAACTTAHPNAMMVMPFDASIGSAICDRQRALPV